MDRRALLVINRDKDEARALAPEIGAVLAKRGYRAVPFSYSRNDGAALLRENPGEGFDIGLSLGGDGTVLVAVRALAPRGTPVLPVNMGTLGFIAGVAPERWEEAFTGWEAGRAVVSRRLMLDVSVERGGTAVFEVNCLNDAVISASGIAKLIRLEVETETASGERIALGRYRGHAYRFYRLFGRRGRAHRRSRNGNGYHQSDLSLYPFQQAHRGSFR